MTLISCTISRNNSAGGAADANGGFGNGGGIYASTISPTLENTIVSGNEVVGGKDPQHPSGQYGSAAIGPDAIGSVTSGGFNLIGMPDDSSGWVVSDQSGIDPQLGPLGDNGGPTPTMELLPTSPAIDHGFSFGLTTDQRGQPRPFDYPNIPNSFGFPNSNLGDGSDVGAFESVSVAPFLNIRIHRPPDTSTPTNITPAYAILNFQNNSPGTGAQRNQPIMVVQKLSSLGSNPPSIGIANAWTNLGAPTKLIGSNFVTRDEVVESSSFYRLIGPSNNPAFIQPPVTGSASNITTTAASLTGTVTPGGSNTVYWFEYGPDTNNYNQTTPTNSLDTSTNPIPVSSDRYGLTPSTLYHFQLVVMDDWADDTGPDLGGDQQFTTLGLPPVVATTPAPQVSSNCPTCFSALLKGTVNPRSSQTFAWFYYYSDTAASGQTTSQNAGSGNGTNGVQQAVFNLTLGATYYFQIVASNSAGISYGNYQPFTAVPSVPPVVVTTNATYVSCGGDCSPIPVLNGTVNGNGASFTGFFQYGLDTNNYSFDTSQYPFSGNNNSPQSFSFTMTNVTLNTATTYHYRIVAFNGTNEGVGGDKTFLSP